MQRLTLSLLLVVLTAVVGLGWGIDRWYSAQFAEAEDPAVDAYKLLGRELALLLDSNLAIDSSTVSDPDRLVNADKLINAAPLESGLRNDALNNWLATSHLQPQLTAYIDFPLPGDVKNTFETGEPLLLESGNQLSLHFFLAQRQQVLSFNLPDELRQDNNSALRWLLTLLFYSGVIAMVLIWLYPLLRRLALLRKTAQAFGAGDLHARIAPDKHSYIRSIEQDFNRMAQRIEQLIADNKLLSRGLSHDLRTPLARLRFGLDILEEADLNPQQQQNLAHLNRDLVAMESLVEALLNYAKLEQAVIAFSPQSISLAAFATQIRDDFYRDQIELLVEPSVHNYTLQADPEYLAMLIHNLLQNALRYGRGRVQLSVYANAGQLHLQVDDNGPGIPVAERIKVLQPFYRSTQVANNASGHGLGLAIVERIAQWHQAEVYLEDAQHLGGLRVRVVFAASNNV